jgi:hypothetical protein
VTYDIYDSHGKLLHAGICVGRAAEFTGLYSEEIECGVQEFGLSDNENYVVVGTGEPFPGLNQPDKPALEGIPWHVRFFGLVG